MCVGRSRNLYIFSMGSRSKSYRMIKKVRGAFSMTERESREMISRAFSSWVDTIDLRGLFFENRIIIFL